jgi:uncharacterized protein YbjT (DUF2867 family)
MGKQIVTVLGSTGAQGGGVVRALLDQQDWQVRAVTRNARSQAALRLAESGCEIAEADLNTPATLFEALQGSYGLFAVTNFWDRATRMGEFEQGRNLVRAAKEAGIQHFIWSTLPDYEALSGGKYTVPHFTSKARVDAEVKAAGFPHHTFVEAPFYFQNFLTLHAPRKTPDGRELWRYPADKDKCRFPCGDIKELGKIVAAALNQPEKAGNGQYLALASDYLCWQDLVDVLNTQGHKLTYEQVSAEEYDGFFSSAKEFRHMMEFWEENHYFGPDGETKIAQANRLVAGRFTRFEQWASTHMPPS